MSNGERWLYRHRSGMGTVLEFDDGIDYRKVLILDAKYRTTGIDMGVAELDPSLIKYQGEIAIRNHSTEMNATPTDCAFVNDQVVNQYRWEDKNTSLVNTDYWLTKNSEVAQYVRNIVVNGAGCDIPNFQTLQRIYCEGAILDSLDPTVKDYPQYALTTWFNNGVAWSSSQFGMVHDQQLAWGIHCLSINVQPQTDNRNNYVIPVQEL